MTRGRGDVGLAAWQWALLERVAVSLCTYEFQLVPGLLQSEGYARAVFEGTVPVAPDGLLEDFMARRMERQRMLFERPTTPFSFIVEEHVFRRRFGAPDQMPKMFDHVLELSAPRNVTLQVVPLESGLHACLDGPVQLLETPRGQRLAYSEGQQYGRLISDVKEVSLLYQRYDTLRSQALNAKDSRGLLERLRGRWEGRSTQVGTASHTRQPPSRLRVLLSPYPRADRDYCELCDLGYVPVPAEAIRCRRAENTHHGT